MPSKNTSPQLVQKPNTPLLRSVLLVAALALIIVGWVVWQRTKQLSPRITNAPVNVNTTTPPANANTNAVTNTNTAATDDADATQWQTITYQRAEHGFTVSVPGTWSTYDFMGFGDAGQLTSLSGSRSDDLHVPISFFTVGDGVAWYEAEQRNHAKDGVRVTAATETFGTATVQTITTRKTEEDGTTQVAAYYYFPRGTRVYILSASATSTVMDAQRATLRQIVQSFTFIDPKPLVRIKTESRKRRVGTSATATLTVAWQVPEQLNLVDPAFDAVSYEQPQLRDYYKVGTITAGTYQGQALVDIFETPNGPSFRPNLFRVAYNEAAARFVYLEKRSDSMLYMPGTFHYDSTATVPGLTLPDTIAVPNSKQKLIAESYPANTLAQDLENLKTVFTDAAAGAISFDPKQRCFVAQYPDGTVRLYHYQLTFQQQTKSDDIFGATAFVPDVRWNDGTAITEEYTINAPTGGCGPSTCQTLYTDAEVGGLAVLQQTGTTADGDPVYEYKDSNHQVLKDIYEEYSVPQVEGRDLTYEAFAQAHPVFFWKDPFGRWLRFRKYAFLRAAECGKPVIYLYPEQPTDVRVQVQPTGGFTVTEPAYPAGGWTVRAQPDGTLTTQDGHAYPYLFWEGFGLNYQRPREGFVVERRHVPTFLQEKLAVLGLNAKERADFADFWQPRLQASPYAFVTFVAKQDFDRLAPLTVEPQPDTVIRVFMDYEPLAQPMTVVQPQRLTTPERRGFTVVEWGGALHR